MPVPKRKLSRRRRDMRSANKYIIPKIFSTCLQESCNAKIMPHKVCNSCGFYKGISVLKIKLKKSKLENKAV